MRISAAFIAAPASCASWPRNASTRASSKVVVGVVVVVMGGP